MWEISIYSLFLHEGVIFLFLTLGNVWFMNIFSYTDKSTVVQWPSISVGSTFMDSTNLGTKIFPHTHTQKKIQKFPKSKTWICHASSYFQSIYIALGFISNLEMI